MNVALSKTARAILGASLTTITGFGALGIARFGLISTFGLVVARGIGLSLFSAMLIFPSMLLVSERLIQKLSWKGFKE